jgi:hypothetical protein
LSLILFGPDRECNKNLEELHTEELRNLYLSIVIIRCIVLRWLRWAGQDKCMEEVRIIGKILVV